ncbi:MAG: response regulator [Burkholderiales bacterium]|jgi:CheY-like chemotaxis protein|nr:response regulator [Burkholderiales bacterium]
MSKRILILEQDSILRELLVEYLEEEGFSVRSVGGARQILVNPQGPPDLLLASTRELGASGWREVEILKESHPLLKVVLLASSHRRPALLSEGHIRPDGLLYKPFEPARLQRMVRRLLSGPGGAGLLERIRDRVCSGSQELIRQKTRARLRSLEADRDGMYRRYLAAVRSGSLPSGAALEVWDQVEELERARQRALSNESVDLDRLRDAFRFVADLVLAKGRAGAVPPSVRRQPEQVSRKVFAGLYGRLKRGEISTEQLKEAPRLRMGPCGSLEGSEHEQALRRAVWGSGD